MPAAKRPPLPRVQIYWFAVMVIGGFAFGLIGERRPLGGDLFAHPLILFFMTAVAGLLATRAALAKPVPKSSPNVRFCSAVSPVLRLFLPATGSPCMCSPVERR
jgi:hypothetical protein